VGRCNTHHAAALWYSMLARMDGHISCGAPIHYQGDQVERPGHCMIYGFLNGCLPVTRGARWGARAGRRRRNHDTIQQPSKKSSLNFYPICELFHPRPGPAIHIGPAIQPNDLSGRISISELTTVRLGGFDVCAVCAVCPAAARVRGRGANEAPLRGILDRRVEATTTGVHPAVGMHASCHLARQIAC
jgi:hypothetical protein